MAEIDALRDVSNAAVKRYRDLLHGAAACPECEQGIACWEQTPIARALAEKIQAQAAVDTALRQYWKERGY